MKVWYKLQVEEFEADQIEVPETATINDFKRLILAELPSSPTLLPQGCLPGQIHGSTADGSPLRADAVVVPDTTYDTALIVKIAFGSNSSEIENPTPPDSKKLKLKHPFDIQMLRPPLDVLPPTKPTKPQFTCNEDWMATVQLDIMTQLDRADDPSGDERISPMALVRCSRGGKTRALYEIANKMHEPSSYRDPVAVIFVTFNDFSSAYSEDQCDPVQALCRRIAFAALKDPPKDKDKLQAFKQFQSKNYDIQPKHIEEWLGNNRAILLIDELNNLKDLAEKTHSNEATCFGKFVKENFLSSEGRYLVFSSHVLSTVSAFGEFVDPSEGSFRQVLLQELPIVDDLPTATVNLYLNLSGAREAIYFGLLPGLIYQHGRGISPVGTQEAAVRRYKAEESDIAKDKKFKEILKSLFTGDVDNVPDRLRVLLDSCGKCGSKKVRWVPFHLSYVLNNVQLSEGKLSRLSLDMAKLCENLKDSDEASGKGWEGLFVLFLVARCINSCPDGYFLPHKWFMKSPELGVEFNQYYNKSKLLDQCKTWTELKEGIMPSSSPKISILYPSHSSFNCYDAIAVFSVDNTFEDVYGYQLKEGQKKPTKFLVQPDFTHSFVIKGVPPIENIERENTWTIASGKAIDTFFGESGKYWTPQHWKKLTDTCKK